MEPEFTNIYSTKEEERLKEEFPLLHGKPGKNSKLSYYFQKLTSLLARNRFQNNRFQIK